MAIKSARFALAGAALAFCATGIVATLPGSAVSVRAQTREGLVVGVEWLAERLDDPTLVLLHLGQPADYPKQHIPGARLVGLYDVHLQTSNGLTLEMMPLEDLRAKLEALGISDNSRIVVYAAATPAFSQVARLMFTLDRVGLGARAAVLDGGLTAWTRAGRPVTDIVPAVRPGKLSALTAKPTVVDADFVDAHRNRAGFRVIDARLPAFYDGEQTGGSAEARHKAGHIANAGSVPHTTVLDAEGRLKPRAELEALFAQAGVKPGDTVVGYCHIGQQASAMLFAARAVGYPVLLYDGSFEDWSRRPNAAVEVKKK